MSYTACTKYPKKPRLLTWSFLGIAKVPNSTKSKLAVGWLVPVIG